MPPRYLFIDDATGPHGDAERYRQMLNKAGELIVDLVRPDRTTLLVPETDLDAPIDGYILDINLSDQVGEDGSRFLGTGAGIAQDLRLLQALGPERGQRARPIVRLCAAQVFQDYLAGDNSTADIFDLGFDKETVGDIAAEARAKIACLPDIYTAIGTTSSDVAGASALLGLSAEEYEGLHSRLRGALESELDRKAHEAVSFLIRQLLEPSGPLIGEDALAVRLGIDVRESPGWAQVKQQFEMCRYHGVGGDAFVRWWAPAVLARCAELGLKSLFQLTAVERVAELVNHGFHDISPLCETPQSPGDRPWLLSASSEPELRVAVDPRFAFPLTTTVAPWLDEEVWSLEQAKRGRNSPQLSEDSRNRLRRALARPAQ